MDFETGFSSEKHFTFVGKGYSEKIFFDDIIYIQAIEGSINKVDFKTADRVIRITGLMEKIRKRLDDRFYTCRKDFDVNITKVESFLGGIVYMEDGSTVQVVQRKQSEFRQILLNYWRPFSTFNLD